MGLNAGVKINHLKPIQLVFGPETDWFLTLGYSNWTICNLLKKFCPKMFPPFNPASHNKPFLITPERQKKEAARVVVIERERTVRSLSITTTKGRKREMGTLQK